MQNPVEVVATARNAFNSGITKTLEFRKEQMVGLLRFYDENTNALIGALAEDIRKPKMEAVISELNHLKNEARNIIYNLKKWMKPTKCSKTLIYILDEAVIHPEPYGVVLIIGAWNYPLELVFGPLAGAMAAGNCAIVKPSELAPVTAKLITEVLPQYIHPECYQIYNGGPEETTAILKERFDYILYTGSTRVGKIVYQAAAKFLTPVTLELGGKSPVYLDKSADIELAVSRIMWGKCLNAGQSCIAPDYMLCSKEVAERFVAIAKVKIPNWYGLKIKDSPDFGRMVNDAHFNRLVKLLKGANVAYGGDYDAKERYIQPTIITNVSADDPIMQEEVFGPILPILYIETVEEAITFINEREKPLVMYAFSNKGKDLDMITKQTSSGNVVINETMMHFSCDSLPFGGVGNSGMGAYHGKHSFDTFSHKKGVLIKNLYSLGEFVQTPRYPPYSEEKLRFIILMTRKLPAPAWEYVFGFCFVAFMLVWIFIEI